MVTVWQRQVPQHYSAKRHDRSRDRTPSCCDCRTILSFYSGKRIVLVPISIPLTLYQVQAIFMLWCGQCTAKFIQDETSKLAKGFVDRIDPQVDQIAELTLKGSNEPYSRLLLTMGLKYANHSTFTRFGYQRRSVAKTDQSLAAYLKMSQYNTLNHQRASNPLPNHELQISTILGLLQDKHGQTYGAWFPNQEININFDFVPTQRFGVSFPPKTALYVLGSDLEDFQARGTSLSFHTYPDLSWADLGTPQTETGHAVERIKALLPGATWRGRKDHLCVDRAILRQRLESGGHGSQYEDSNSAERADLQTTYWVMHD